MHKKFVRRRTACRDAKRNRTTRAFGLIREATRVASRYFPHADALDSRPRTVEASTASSQKDSPIVRARPFVRPSDSRDAVRRHGDRAQVHGTGNLAIPARPTSLGVDSDTKANVPEVSP